MVSEKTFVLDVLFPLLGIGLAFQGFFAIFAAPTGEKAHARRALVVHDKVRIVFELARTIGLGERGEFKARSQLHHHLLPWPHVTIRLE